MFGSIFEINFLSEFPKITLLLKSVESSLLYRIYVIKFKIELELLTAMGFEFPVSDNDQYGSYIFLYRDDILHILSTHSTAR